MKKLALFLLIIFAVFSLNAQTDFLDNTTMTSYGFGFDKIIPHNKDSKVTTALQIGGSYNLKHLYFKDNIVFQNTDNGLIMFPDTNSSHGYPNRFFNSGYTRLTGQYLRLKLGGGVLFYQFISVTTGINMDFRVGSKYKNKYFVGGDKKKDIIKGNDALKLCNTQFSWFVSVNIKNNISVYYEYQFRNFLKEDWGTDIRNHGIGIAISTGGKNNKQ